MDIENTQRMFTKKRLGILAVVTVGIIVLICNIVMYLSSDARRLQRKLELGQKYLEELDYEQAVVEFEKAIAIDAKSVEAYLGLAEAYECMGDYEKKLEILATGYEVTGEGSILEKVEEIKNLLEQKQEELHEEKIEPDMEFQDVSSDVIKIYFERFYEGLYEYAIITGIDRLGNIVWIYQTDKYMGGDLNNISEIATEDDGYYFVENGSIIVLNISDGTVKWKNDSFRGGDPSFVFGDDGNLYICGYFVPDFFAVDKDGNTIKRIESFDSNYYWPYQIDYLDNQIAIVFDGCTDWTVSQTVFYVNLDDFSYYKGESQYEDSLITDQKELGNGNIIAQISNTFPDSFPYTSHLLVTLDDGTIIGEAVYFGPDEYTGYYGVIEMGDLTNDGQDEILVKLECIGSTYGAADVYVYTINGNDLVEILHLDSDEINKIYPELWKGTGATIEGGFLKVEGLVDGEGFEKTYSNISIKYQNGAWIRIDEKI